jgi:type II secretory pathway pseudopilin PulG
LAGQLIRTAISSAHQNTGGFPSAQEPTACLVIQKFPAIKAGYMSRFKQVIKYPSGPATTDRERIVNWWQRRKKAFTVFELVTVMGIIGLLSGIVMATARYAMRTTHIQATRAELAAIDSALEAYKLDHGAYPTSGLYRISIDGSAELSNSAALYAALAGGPQRYLRLPASDLITKGGLTAIVDGFGQPLCYYNTSPVIPGQTINDETDATIGGQVNTTSYDLFSYGPDHATFASDAFNPSSGFASPGTAADDIWSSRRPGP